MALGAATQGAEVGQEGGPTFFQLLTFLGDDAYPTGGTENFQAFVRTSMANRGNVEVIGVIPQDCGLHRPVYDKATDKLKVLLGSTGVEVGAGDNSAITYNLIVLCR